MSHRAWRVFFRNRRAVWSLTILALVSVLSLGAELLSNYAPIVLRYQGKTYFPVFKTYSGTDLGLTSPVEPDYKTLDSSLAPDDFMIWPPVRWGYNESNYQLSTYPSPPSSENLLGTDDRGRDVLARLIYGFRVSMSFGMANVILAVLFAVLIGGCQGYFGGIIDMVGQRLLEIWSSLPYLYVLTLIVSIFEPGLMALIIVTAMFVWITLSIYVRAEYLKLRKLEFSEAARSLGAKPARIIAKHIFPNSLTPIVTFAPFILATAIIDLAVLDYLGLGVRAPTASLGELLRQGRQYFINSWWLAVFPFITLVGAMICLNFVGEGLREAFDPRKAER